MAFFQDWLILPDRGVALRQTELFVQHPWQQRICVTIIWFFKLFQDLFEPSEIVKKHYDM